MLVLENLILYSRKDISRLQKICFPTNLHKYFFVALNYLENTLWYILIIVIMPPQIYINPTCSFSLPFFIPSSARCSLLAKCFPERNETTLIHGSYSSNNINFDLPSEFPGTLTSLNEREYAANLVQVDLILCEFVPLRDFLFIWIFFNRVIQNVHSVVHFAEQIHL